MSVLLRKKKEITLAEFHRYWSEHHAKVVMGLPEFSRYIRRYVQCHTVQKAYTSDEAPYDGIAEVWFDSLEALQQWRSLPERAVIFEDEQRFLERDQMVFVVTEELYKM